MSGYGDEHAIKAMEEWSGKDLAKSGEFEELMKELTPDTLINLVCYAMNMTKVYKPLFIKWRGKR